MTNYTVFIGNPGTGKSTLLNGIIGKVLFHSGVSFGKGLTTALQLQKAENGDFYGDTPGLADVKIREKAAAEISKALRSGEGDYKLVFVVTEEEGRVRPADGVTMNLVLEALPKDREVPYGIIVNKITKKKKDILESNRDKFSLFVACLNEGRSEPTAYIHLYQKVEGLEDEDDKLHEPTPALMQWLRMLPPVRLKPDEVQDVKANEFDAQVEALQTQLEELRNDKKKLEAKMEKDRKKLEKQMLQMDEDHKKEMAKAHADAMNNMREAQENHQKAMTKLQESQHKARGEELKKILDIMKEKDEKHEKAMNEARKRQDELIKQAQKKPSSICVIS